MKKFYTALVGLCMLVFSSQAQTITINSPTTGQATTIGSSVTVNFSSSSTLSYGMIQLYKGATAVGSPLTGASYPGTNYSLGTTSMVAGTDYRVRVYDYGNPSREAWSGYFTLQVMPPPVATAATSVISTSFVANWNSVGGATAYYFDLSMVSNFSSFVSYYNNLNTSALTGGTTSKLISAGVNPGMTYYYRLRASNANGASFNSNTISVLLQPAIPTVNAASNVGQTSFTANWSTVTGASEYRLDVSADNFATFVSGYNNLQVLSNSQSVTGLSGGPFKYRVRAANASGSSGSSSAQSVDLASVVSPGTGNQVNECGTYVIYYYGLLNARAEVHLNTVSGTIIETLGAPPNSLSPSGTNTVSASSLTAGNSYQIKVYDNSNPSNYAVSGIFSVVAIQPVASITLVSKTNTTIKISWLTVSGASSYSIDVATSSNFSSGVVWNGHSASPSDASGLDITGLTYNTTYYVRIKAVASCASSAYTSTFNWTTDNCAPLSPAPTANAATTVKATSFVANWTALAGATEGYDIAVTLGATTENKTSGPGTTSATISMLHPSSNYTYKVRGKSACTTSAYSSNINVTTLVLPAPGITYSASQSTNVWKIAWGNVAEATSYEFEMFLDSAYRGSPSFYQYSSSLSAEFDKPNCGTYYIRIRSKVGTSDYSAWTTDTLPPGAGCGGRMVQNPEDKLDQSPTASEAEPSPGVLDMIASPNPVETILRVIIPSKMKKERLNFNFIDVTGRTLSPSTQLFSGYAEIDVRPVPSGLYILSVSDGVNIHRTKVIRK